MIGNGQNSVQWRPWEHDGDCIGSILKVKAAVYVSYDTHFIRAKFTVPNLDLIYLPHLWSKATSIFLINNLLMGGEPEIQDKTRL